jgi:Flp pilus assembly protein TadB
MRAAKRTVVITDAEQSQDDQLRSRQLRYLVMMSIRAACLILAAVLVSMRVPMVGLWVAMCVIAMILLPWLAVLIANDRPVKPEHRLRHRPLRSEEPPPSNAVTERGEPKVIDVDL